MRPALYQMIERHMVSAIMALYTGEEDRAHGFAIMALSTGEEDSLVSHM